MKIAFLFGAGLSIPACPNWTTINLTNAILSGEGYKRHSDCRYRNDNHSSTPDYNVHRVLKYLLCLRDEIARFNNASVDYEDIAYLAAQIYDSCGMEYENPALLPFMERIGTTVEEGCRLGCPDNAWEPRRLYEEALVYIKSVISCELNSKKSPKYLSFLKEAAVDNEVDIFTLNHDTLVENYLGNKGINYFSVSRDNRDSKASSKTKIRLFKLHGSIDWFTKDNNYCPEMLVGKFNKILDYSRLMFSELYARFVLDFPKADMVIIIGYSFGDKGINNRIIDWLDSHPKKKILVIDTNIKCIANARGAIRRLKNRFHVYSHEDWTEKMNWKEMKKSCK